MRTNPFRISHLRGLMLSPSRIFSRCQHAQQQTEVSQPCCDEKRP